MADAAVEQLVALTERIERARAVRTEQAASLLKEGAIAKACKIINKAFPTEVEFVALEKVGFEPRHATLALDSLADAHSEWAAARELTSGAKALVLDIGAHASALNLAEQRELTVQFVRLVTGLAQLHFLRGLDADARPMAALYATSYGVAHGQPLPDYKDFAADILSLEVGVGVRTLV